MSNDPNMKKVSSTTGNNWDLIATHKDTKEKIKIEVKTTAKKEFALVDISDSQVVKDENNKVKSIKADELWVVVDVESERPKLYQITKANFEKMVNERPESIESKIVWKIKDKIAEKYAKKVV